MQYNNVIFETTIIEHLKKIQKKYPPKYPRKNGLDRAEGLLELLLPELPEPVQDGFKSGCLCVGEIGLNKPFILTKMVDDLYVIEVSSGMFDLIYALVRSFSGLMELYTGSSDHHEKALEFSQVLQNSVKTLKRYKRFLGLLKKWPRIKYPEFKISSDIKGWTENIATTIEIFMLAHELGHIVCNLGGFTPVTNNKEEDADICGLHFFLPSAQNHVGIRMAYASAYLAIRLFSMLEWLGVRFQSEYPEFSKRVEFLSDRIKSACPDEQFYRESSTIKVAYEDFLEEVEKVINKRYKAPLISSERTTIRMISILEAAAEEYISISQLKDNFHEIQNQVPEMVFDQAMQTLSMDYIVTPSLVYFIKMETREKMGEILREL